MSGYQKICFAFACILASIVVFSLSSCEDQKRPKCLDFGDNPKEIANPEKCIPKEF